MTISPRKPEMFNQIHRVDPALVLWPARTVALMMMLDACMQEGSRAALQTLPAPRSTSHRNSTSAAFLDANMFFLPLLSRQTPAGQDIPNAPLWDHLRSHTLEAAEVSGAARAHVRRLRAAGVPPAEWRDAASAPVLNVAIRSNYVALAAWLLRQGVPLPAVAAAEDLLEHCRARRWTVMADWLDGALHATA